MSMLTREWQEYDHNYTKAIHDIRTADGKEYYNCWPNAGKFNVMAKEDKDCIQIPDADVTHVRCNKSWMTEEEQEAGESKVVYIEAGKGARFLSIAAHTNAIMATDKKSNIAEDSKPLVGISLPNGTTWHDYKDAIVIENTYHPKYYTKKYKPNTGLILGSYKYKTKLK